MNDKSMYIPNYDKKLSLHLIKVICIKNLSQLIKKHVYKTLGTSLLYRPVTPSSLKIATTKMYEGKFLWWHIFDVLATFIKNVPTPHKWV